MNRLNKRWLIIPALATVYSASSMAGGGYLDYRHEYLNQTRVHYDRAKMGYFFDSGFDVHLEIMWKATGNKDVVKNENGATTKPANRDRWGDFENNGHGITINYAYRPEYLPGVTITPTFSIYTSSYWTTYEPGVELAYRFNPEWRVRARYRQDLDKPRGANYGKASNQTTHRYDFWVDWKPADTNLSMTYNFVWYDTETVRWNNKTYDYAQEFKVGYSMKPWTPYIAIGDVKGADKLKDNRQIRWRAGLSYGF